MRIIMLHRNNPVKPRAIAKAGLDGRRMPASTMRWRCAVISGPMPPRSSSGSGRTARTSGTLHPPARSIAWPAPPIDIPSGSHDEPATATGHPRHRIARRLLPTAPTSERGTRKDHRLAVSLRRRRRQSDLQDLYQQVLLKRFGLEHAATALDDPDHRQLAYGWRSACVMRTVSSRTPNGHSSRSSPQRCGLTAPPPRRWWHRRKTWPTAGSRRAGTTHPRLLPHLRVQTKPH